MVQFSSLYGARLDREIGTDDSTVLFTTARRKAAVNEGIAEFANLTECCQRRATFSIVSKTSEYDLNSTTIIPGGDFSGWSKEDVQYVYTDASSNVTVLSGDDLPRRDVHWLDRYMPGWNINSTVASTAQLPQVYYVRPDGPSLWIGFTPQPIVASSATAVVRVPYIASPAALTTDTSEPFTFNSSVRTDLRSYHQGLVHYAAHLMEKLRRDDSASDRQLQKFMAYVQRYTQNMRVKGGRAWMQGKNYFGRRVGGWDWYRKDPRT